MKGPGDFLPDDDDDRIDRRVEELIPEIEANRERVLELDAEKSELLDGEQYEAIFTALADLDGKEPADLLGSDVLATLYRLGKTCAGMREQAIKEDAEAQAERESRDWPAWRGTAQATAHHARMHYRDEDFDP